MRHYGLALFIIVTALVSACQSHTPIPDDTIVIAVDLPPAQLDPRLSTDAVGSKIKDLVCNGLMVLNDQLEMVPDLALSYRRIDDLTFEFTLRQDVVFHDGAPLTSRDVKATYDSLRSDKIVSPYKGSLAFIRSIDATDPRRVVFYLDTTSASLMTTMTYAILPARLAVQERTLAASEIVGTGPFAIESVNGDSGKITFRRHRDYHGGAPRVEKIVIWPLQDPTLRSLELMKGRIDLVQNALPYVLVPRLKTGPNLSFTADTGVNFNYLAFNFANPYLKNLNVRKAVAMAVDRDKIIRYKLAGLARPADSLLTPRHWAHNPSLTQPAFNLDTAKKLLDASGLEDPDGDGPLTRFDLVYKTSTNKERIEIVRLIAENLRAIGIGVEVRSFEFGTLSRDIRQGDFDLFSMTWVGIFDPDIYYTIFHSAQVPPAGANRGRYVNTELDKLLEASRVTPDAAVRLALLHRIQEIVHEDYVYVPLWYDDNFVVMNRRVKGYKLRPNAGFTALAEAWKE